MPSANRPQKVPTAVEHCEISFPAPHVLLVVINRPKTLNSLSVEASYELDQIFQWFDDEPSLRAAIITGAGSTFCVGADLKGKFSHYPKNNN